jgi:hypothetical protein
MDLDNEELQATKKLFRENKRREKLEDIETALKVLYVECKSNYDIQKTNIEVSKLMYKQSDLRRKEIKSWNL